MEERVEKSEPQPAPKEIKVSTEVTLADVIRKLDQLHRQLEDLAAGQEEALRALYRINKACWSLVRGSRYRAVGDRGVRRRSRRPRQGSSGRTPDSGYMDNRERR